MINIVTWLDNTKYNEELSTVCAGNGIRIVADTFKNPQDFLRKFDEIDTNIDVLVLGNGNLEGLDKHSFFEDVCVTEPNLRIIIVFPGYRNQYVEPQITEYKSLGIFDVIYEGQKIDEDSFVDVIKSGYIYDYDINVYDEPSERVAHTPQKCVSIGVLGLTHGCGVTNMTINLANYISLTEDCSVRAIDLSDTGNLRFAKGKKAAFIVHSGIDIARLERTSRAIVYDFGTPFNITSKGRLASHNSCHSDKSIELFKKCDLKICMCYSDSWHIGKLKYLLNDRAWKKSIDKTYIFLLDSMPDKLRLGRAKINIYTRNDEAVQDCIDELFAKRRVMKDR